MKKVLWYFGSLDDGFASEACWMISVGLVEVEIWISQRSTSALQNVFRLKMRKKLTSQRHRQLVVSLPRLSGRYCHPKYLYVKLIFGIGLSYKIYQWQGPFVEGVKAQIGPSVKLLCLTVGRSSGSSPSTKEHHAHVILLSIKTLKNINSTDNLKCKYRLQVERAL